MAQAVRYSPQHNTATTLMRYHSYEIPLVEVPATADAMRNLAHHPAPQGTKTTAKTRPGDLAHAVVSRLPWGRATAAGGGHTLAGGAVTEKTTVSPARALAATMLLADKLFTSVVRPPGINITCCTCGPVWLPPTHNTHALLPKQTTTHARLQCLSRHMVRQTQRV